MQNGSTTTLEEPAAAPAAAGAHKSVSKTRGTVARNPRTVAISKISNILDGLDETSRTTVVQFIAGEYKDCL